MRPECVFRSLKSRTNMVQKTTDTFTDIEKSVGLGRLTFRNLIRGAKRWSRRRRCWRTWIFSKTSDFLILKKSYYLNMCDSPID